MALRNRTKWPEGRNYINIKILRADGTVNHFMIKKKCPLSKFMDSYCKTHDFYKPAVKFRFDGEKIEEADTPSSLKMQNGDIIELFIIKTGG